MRKDTGEVFDQPVENPGRKTAYAMNGGHWYTGEGWYRADRVYVRKSGPVEDFAAKLP